MANILIIDDDPNVSKLLSLIVCRSGHQAVRKATLDAGVAEAFKKPYDIIFLDVHLPDGNGLDALPHICQASSSPVVIILTAYGHPDGARIAIQNGAWDYIQKTDDNAKIRFQINRAIEYREELQNHSNTHVALNLDGIIGDSPKMKACYDLLAQASNNDVNVHLAGETGVGKEIFARAIHRNSSRKNQPFVTVDCSVMHKNLKESDLFGYLKGAFTGADRNREGLIALANGGVLFLDEIGDLSLAGQGLFLRVLQERCFRPLGGKKDIQSNFRLITATNKDIDQLVKESSFRLDLLFRLRGIVIDLPPLKERNDDIEVLTFHYINKLCDRKASTGVKGVSSDFMHALRSYPWPGNVRELVKALETALSSAKDVPTLFPFHLPTHIRTYLAECNLEKSEENIIDACKAESSFEKLPRLDKLLETTECKYLQYLFSETRGDVKQIKQISGLSRSALYRRLKKYQIKI